MKKLDENLGVFLDHILENNLNEAKESLNVVMSRKAVQALDEKKKEVASTLFKS